MQLHLEFVPASFRGSSHSGQSEKEANRAAREAARKKQTSEIVALVRGHKSRMENALEANEKYRVAVLGRTRKALAPVAEALRQAAIPFRAVELEELKHRPEIVDALVLARALLNPQDRVAWLGVLRAPWCGLSLADLHALTSADNDELLGRPVPELAAERICNFSAAKAALPWSACRMRFNSRSGCVRRSPRSRPEPGWSKSGCGSAARIASMQQRAPTSICFGAALTA